MEEEQIKIFGITPEMWVAIIALLGTVFTAILTFISTKRNNKHNLSLQKEIEELKSNLQIRNLTSSKSIELDFKKKENFQELEEKDLNKVLVVIDQAHSSIQRVKEEISRVINSVPNTMLYSDLAKEIEKEVENIIKVYGNAGVIPNDNVSKVFHKSKKTCEKVLELIVPKLEEFNSNQSIPNEIREELINLRKSLSSDQDSLLIQRRQIKNDYA